MAKSILEKAPDEFKGKLIENILEQILKNPEMLSKLRNEIKNSKEGENLE
jgi:predicted component of type VI protein secretion system